MAECEFCGGLHGACACSTGADVPPLDPAPPAAEVGNWPRYYLARLQEDFAAELEQRRAGGRRELHLRGATMTRRALTKQTDLNRGESGEV